VRLVDGEERNAYRRDAGPERGRAEPFGSDVDDLELAAADPLLAVVALGIGERAVHEGRRDSPRRERVRLVLHERHERGGDDGGTLEENGGELVAEALPRAGRHDGDGRPPREHRPHDLFLPGPEALVAEMAAHCRTEIEPLFHFHLLHAAAAARGKSPGPWRAL